MDTKHFITVSIALIVGIILISGVVAPVIANVSSNEGEGNNGQSFTNPPTQLRYAYAEGDIPDFQLDAEMSMGADGALITFNSQTITIDDVSSINPDDLDTINIICHAMYLDEFRIIGLLGEGFAVVEIIDGAMASIITGGGMSLSCSDGVITATIPEEANPQHCEPYSFDAPDWCYYADENGEYGRYDRSQIEGGLFASDKPMCPFGYSDDLVGSRTISYRDDTFFFDPLYVPASLSVIEDVDADGRLNSIGWDIDGTVISAGIFVLPLSGESEGTGSAISSTLSTLLSVIPLLLTVGLVIGAIAFMRRS